MLNKLISKKSSRQETEMKTKVQKYYIVFILLYSSSLAIVIGAINGY